MSLPFAFPYSDSPNGGYWGKATSTIDWCEENYVVTTYIAEAMNTISNSVFISLALFAVYSARKNNLELRFVLIGLGFAIVGLGSWLFHMTLKYEFQLLDELPMIYATCIPLWSVCSEGKSHRVSTTIALSIAIGANLLTAIYLHYKDPTLHQVAYAVLNLMLILRSHYLTSKRINDPAAKKHLYQTMVLGIVVFGAGFFLWNLDVHFCNFWIRLRRSVGVPYGFFFELHAWWHILTGTGVYFYVVYLEYLRIFLLHQEGYYEFVKHFGFLPEVRLKHTKSE